MRTNKKGGNNISIYRCTFGKEREIDGTLLNIPGAGDGVGSSWRDQEDREEGRRKPWRERAVFEL